MENFVETFLEISSGLGYWGILLLMTIESSFIPFPSEIVVPPAAFLAARGEMNVYLVIIMGILGSLLGAIINYVLALFLGRLLIYKLVEKKWARIFLLSRKNVEKAEKYFLNYGEISTFLGRLVPVIRQLISLPAGFAKMNFWSFLFYTFLGSGIWVSILAALGYYFGANEAVFKEYYSEMSLSLVFVVLVVILLVYILKRKKNLTK